MHRICLYFLLLISFGSFNLGAAKTESKNINLRLDLSNEKNTKVVVGFTDSTITTISVDTVGLNRLNSISLLQDDNLSTNEKLVFSAEPRIYYQINSSNDVKIYLLGKNFKYQDDSVLELGFDFPSFNDGREIVQVEPSSFFDSDYDFGYFIPDKDEIVCAEIFKLGVNATVAISDIAKLPNKETGKLALLYVIGD